MATTKKLPTPLGQAILARLRVLHQSQPWLAEQCGVSTAAVTKWIYYGQIRTESAVAAAKALALTVDQLLSGDLEAAERPLVATERATATYARRNGSAQEPLSAIAERLSPDNRRQLLDYALDLLKAQPPE